MCRALVEEVTNLVTGLATRQEVDVISQRLDDKSDAFTLQALQASLHPSCFVGHMTPPPGCTCPSCQQAV